MKNVVFKVSELDCSSCVKPIEKQLKKNGIYDYQVDLMSKTISINYDEKKFDVDSVAKILKKAGFTVTLINHEY